MGSWTRSVTAAATALSVATVLLATTVPPAAAGSTVVRDDDGSQEAAVLLDYTDDVARKRLVLPAGTMSGATGATLSMYLKAEACGASGVSHRIRVNGIMYGDINPCDWFSSAAYTWFALPLNLNHLVDGATNTFEIEEVAGDWTDRNIRFGVDTGNDFGRSDIYQTNTSYTGDIGGELMWYLTVVSPTPTPAMGVNPNYLQFGTLAVGSTSAYQTVTVTSTGTATLAVTSVTLGGDYPGDYQKASDGCTGASLAPGLSCTFQIRFTPSATYARSAVATVSGNAGDRTVTLAGTGAYPSMSASPRSIAFGTVAVGSASPARTVVVTSDGSSTLAVSGIEMTGSHPSDFTTLSDTCSGASLPPGATCSFQVRFLPTASGYRWAAATVRTNATGVWNIALNGSGDALAPTSEFTTANGSVVLSGDPVLGISTDDASRIALVDVTFSPVTSALTPSTVVATLSWCTVTSCEWSAAAPLLPGIYLVNARATDAFGRVEAPGRTITVVVA